jgi:hypothetical protein
MHHRFHHVCHLITDHRSPEFSLALRG